MKAVLFDEGSIEDTMKKGGMRLFKRIPPGEKDYSLGSIVSMTMICSGSTPPCVKARE